MLRHGSSVGYIGRVNCAASFNTTSNQRSQPLGVEQMKEIFSLYLTRDWKAKLGEVMWPRVKITFLQIITVAILIIDPFQVSYEENNEPTYE